MRLALLTALVTLPAFAATPCQTIDLSPSFTPPRHQGDSLYCYAFTATDAIGYALGIVPPNELSAFDTLSHFISLHDHEIADANDSIVSNAPFLHTIRSAAAIKKGLPLHQRGNGQNGLAAAAVLNRGYACLEKDVPSQPIGNGFPANRQMRDFLAERIQKIAADPRGPAPTPPTACAEIIPPRYPWAPFADIPAFVSDWAAQKMRNEVTRDCRKKIPLHGLAVNNYTYVDEPAAAAEKVNEILASRRPAMLSYDICLLHACESDGQPNHASLVVGQGINPATGSCELKIRNSYGAECPPAAPGARCEKGYWFIDRAKLSAAPHMLDEIVKL